MRSILYFSQVYNSIYDGAGSETRTHGGVINPTAYKTAPIAAKGYQHITMERLAGFEPASSGWKPEIITTILKTH